jgi:hypothetical protein
LGEETIWIDLTKEGSWVMRTGESQGDDDLSEEEEEFLDLFIETGALELSSGGRIVYGIGGVGIECESSIDHGFVDDKDLDNPRQFHVSKGCKTLQKDFKLIFQVDSSPTLSCTFYWDSEQEDDGYCGWKSVAFGDSKGNIDPKSNENFREFCYDLQAAIQDEDED